MDTGIKRARHICNVIKILERSKRFAGQHKRILYSKKKMKEEYRSRVYTDRPDYADFDSPAKFTAIQSIIAKRLREHPNAICSYSGGSDSDIMIDLIEKTRKIFDLPQVKYVFFNTGLEMEATKAHVKKTAEKYRVEIREVRPKINIVQATRTYGVPFVSNFFDDPKNREIISKMQKLLNRQRREESYLFGDRSYTPRAKQMEEGETSGG